MTGWVGGQLDDAKSKLATAAAVLNPASAGPIVTVDISSVYNEYGRYRQLGRRRQSGRSEGPV